MRGAGPGWGRWRPAEPTLRRPGRDHDARSRESRAAIHDRRFRRRPRRWRDGGLGGAPAGTGGAVGTGDWLAGASGLRRRASGRRAYWPLVSRCFLSAGGLALVELLALPGPP